MAVWKRLRSPPFLLLLLLRISASDGATQKHALAVHVGVILDYGSPAGMMSNSSIAMALEDFYSTMGRDYQTRLRLHFRDSQSTVARAASEAVDLIRTVGAWAILGPQTSEEADFLAYLGSYAHVPIVSCSALSSLLSPSHTPYFVRMAQNDSTQAKPVAALVSAFGWKEVILVHDDSYTAKGLLPFLTDAVQEAGASIQQRIILSSSSQFDSSSIRPTLLRLKDLQVKVFIVHLPLSICESFFQQAHKEGMMGDGYAWIVTSRIVNSLKSMGPSVLTSMEGVLGVKTYVPKSHGLDNFRLRWKQRFRREHPESDISELDVAALWAYDSTWLLALAVEKAFWAEMSRFPLPNPSPIKKNSTDQVLGVQVSPEGAKLLPAILTTRFQGVSGEIGFVDGQLNSSNIFEIINVVSAGWRNVGYWTPGSGLSKSLSTEKNYSANADDLAVILWPGGTTKTPKSEPMSVTGNVLVIGVPVKTGYQQFVKVEWDAKENRNIAKGFSVAVFRAAMDKLPSKPDLQFQPYDNGHVDELGYYDELIYQVYAQKLNAVVGDTTIVANRSHYVDFTQPYTESGISMIVPIVDDDVTNTFWWFLAPFSKALWFTTIGISLLKGFLICFFESRSENEEFRGEISEVVGKVLYYSFTVFVFANREELKSNYSRFISAVWTFVVFVLVTSYGANLTSILTVEKLRPKVTDLFTLIKNKERIGYQNGSFVLEFLKEQGAEEGNLKAYASIEEFADGLALGSSNGGVSAIVDEIPYINVFLRSYCRNYTMAGRVYPTGGFGFVFPMGSPLVSDVSRAILQLDPLKMEEIEAEWLGNMTCPDPLESSETNYELSLPHFRFIYITTIGAAAITVLVYFINYELEQRKKAKVSVDEDSSGEPQELGTDGSFHGAQPQQVLAESTSDQQARTNEEAHTMESGEDASGSTNVPPVHSLESQRHGSWREASDDEARLNHNR